LAATLALGRTAVLSHRAAGELWAILPASQPLEVTVPSTAGRPHRDGIRVHRQRLLGRDRTDRLGIPTTTLSRTLVDLAAVVDGRALAGALEEAQVRHRLNPALIAAELTAFPGRRGAKALRAVLAGAVIPGQVESILELRFLRLCAAYGLPTPLTQVRIGAWRVDFWFPSARLAVETDGARYHATAAKRRRDAAKTEALEAAGARVLRVRWADVSGSRARWPTACGPPWAPTLAPRVSPEVPHRYARRRSRDPPPPTWGVASGPVEEPEVSRCPFPP
jgi:hypothetical protein